MSTRLWTTTARVWMGAFGLALLAGCLESDPTSLPTPSPTGPRGDATLSTCTDVHPAAPVSNWTFTEVAGLRGAAIAHDTGQPDTSNQGLMNQGGVAAGDFDGDCYTDLFVHTGATTHSVLLRNLGDGAFVDVTATSGIDLTGLQGGAAFVDYNGDGALDLFVSGFSGGPSRFFLSRGDGTFAERDLGVATNHDSYSASFGDYDLDGDLDLFLSHWRVTPQAFTKEYLWRNDGDAFTDATASMGLSGPTYINFFTGNFSDFDGDGWPDLLVSADFGSSRIFRNGAPGKWEDVTTSVVSDENGMGSAVGDYDNDGDLDWFVTSIYDVAPSPFYGSSGNRLYRNAGDGSFEDVTDEAGVRIGGWGWGACFQDFNNDGYLDLFHVNGYGTDSTPQFDPFRADASPLFVSNGDGTFTDMALALGLDDTLQGRGVVCTDFDRDGDVDVFVSNWQGPTRLFLNQTPGGAGFLNVQLRFVAPNTQGIGARIQVRTGSLTQTRELRAGSNFESQDPPEAHFGLGTAPTVDELHVVWPDGTTDTFTDVAPNQFLLITHPEAGTAP